MTQPRPTEVFLGAIRAYHAAEKARQRAEKALMELEVRYRHVVRIVEACVSPAMPEANGLTREITAVILAERGLVNEEPPPPRHSRRRRAKASPHKSTG
jgi:hypothetical protein